MQDQSFVLVYISTKLLDTDKTQHIPSQNKKPSEQESIKESGLAHLCFGKLQAGRPVSPSRSNFACRRLCTHGAKEAAGIPTRVSEGCVRLNDFLLSYLIHP